MVRDDVEQDLDRSLRRVGDEAIEVVERAVRRLDVEVVGDVVAVIALWRREARRQPDGVDAEIAKVIEVLTNALDVTAAVAVAVGERSRVQLVDDGVCPPQVVARIRCFQRSARFGHRRAFRFTAAVVERTTSSSSSLSVCGSPIRHRECLEQKIGTPFAGIHQWLAHCRQAHQGGQIDVVVPDHRQVVGNG